MCKEKKRKERKEIVIKKNSSISFPNAEDVNGDILIIGNYNGICGDVKWTRNGLCEIADDFYDMDSNVFVNNMNTLLNALRNGNKIIIVSSNDTILYFKNLLYSAAEIFLLYAYDNNRKKIKNMFNHQVYTIDTTELYEETYAEYNADSKKRRDKAKNEIDDIVTNKIFENIKHMKFDTIIQNPPYNGSLHLDFLEKGLDLLNENGKMVIVEPATWLINIRKNGKAKRYDAIKQRLEGHIESVVIENLNKEFGTENQVPFATTTIDMSKTFKTIEFSVCGEKRIVDSVYDCNLIGKYDTVWSILNKVGVCKDMMSNHTTNIELSDDVWYAKYAEIGRCGCSSGDRAHLDSYYYGEVFKYFYFNGYDNRDEISNHPLKVKDGGNRDTDKNANCVYGSKKEMENWAYFNMNNKLPLFINYVLSIDQNNNSKEFLPWLVDKQYTDDEINKMFGFTDEEIKLIDTTIKKYERNSPWFKRYMCGKKSVTDEEVNNFIAEINM